MALGKPQVCRQHIVLFALLFRTQSYAKERAKRCNGTNAELQEPKGQSIWHVLF
jgi:hypothetical protein